MIFSLSPKHLVVFLIASLSILSHPPVSTAQSEIKNLLNKLDSHYYYPQKKGLTSISAKLTWEQQDTSAKNTFFLKSPISALKGRLATIFLKKNCKQWQKPKCI